MEYKIKNKSIGCIIYAIYAMIFSFAAFMLPIVSISIIDRWLVKLSGPGYMVGSTLGMVASFYAIYKCYRNYKKRASFFIKIFEDHLILNENSEERKFSYEDIQTLQIYGNFNEENSFKIAITMKDGKKYNVPKLENSSKLWKELTTKVNSLMLSKSLNQIENNQSLVFKEGSKSTILAVFFIIYILGVCAAFIVNIVNKGDITNIHPLHIFIIASGLGFLHRYFFTGIGIEITKIGIKKLNKANITHIWSEIILIKKTPNLGIEIHFQDKGKITISDKAENYFLLTPILQNFIEQQRFIGV